MSATNLNAAPGNTPIDPDGQAQLIPNLATQGELDEWERRNIIEGRDWALGSRTMRNRDPFDESYLREVHERMFDQTWKWAGTYRNSEKTFGCLVHEIRERIGALLGDTRYWADNRTFRLMNSRFAFITNWSGPYTHFRTETADTRVSTQM
jgi:fido (protein-threonine AMPylation protein)